MAFKVDLWRKSKDYSDMSANVLFLTNVICPLISGIALLCFALYFFYAGEGLFLRRARFTPLFLLTFGIFVLGRPVQLLIGPSPWPLIINIIRAVLLIAISCPLVLFQARALSAPAGSHARLRLPFIVGIALTAIYTFAMLAGSTQTVPIFELGSLIAYECTPASFTPPLFARELAQVAQMVAGIGFFGLAGYETLKTRKTLAGTAPRTRHLLFFALGCLIFGGAYAIGSLTKQWWFYYLSAVPSAFFMGMGVREDIIYARSRIKRVIPFLRDELFYTLSTGRKQEEKLQELKDLLGKQVSPTIVLTISSGKHNDSKMTWIKSMESAQQHLTEMLDQKLGAENHLLIPVGSGRFAVCLDADDGKVRELADQLRNFLVTHGQMTAVIGIGGKHPTEELQHSYLESQTALRAADQKDRPVVSYIDIGAFPSQRQFPVQARDEFLLEFKHVHNDSALRRLQILLEQMLFHAEDNVVVYRVRLLELLGMILNQVNEQGNDNPDLVSVTASAFDDLHRLETVGELTNQFKTTVEKLISRVTAPTVEKTSVNPLNRAKAYIRENISEDLKVADVARQSFVSVSQLQRLFKETMGTTFSAWLTRVRIQKAKELLCETDRPTTDIAFEVGYNDSNYFSTAFRKHEGISPSQYRKQSKDDGYRNRRQKGV